MTGYLTTSGQDLSGIFMPIANNTFNNGLIINNNLTLPTAYASLPTQFQLGGKPLAASFGDTSLTSGQVTSPVNITLPAGGVYFIEFLISFSQTASGSMTRFRLGASTINTDINIVESSEYMLGVSSTNYNYRFIASGIYATTASLTIYGVHSYTFTGGAKASGSISYTRIA